MKEDVFVYGIDGVPFWVVWWIAIHLVVMIMVFILVRQLWAVWSVGVAGLWGLQGMLEEGAVQQWVFWLAVISTIGLVVRLYMHWLSGLRLRKRQAAMGLAQQNAERRWEVLYNGRWYHVRNVAAGQRLPPLVKVVRIDGNNVDVEVEP